jgi:hypothetical protein
MSDLLGTPYDYGLLALNGEHGGNILTAVLPTPAGQQVEVALEDGGFEVVPTHERPWLPTIDTDHIWRQDSKTATSELFRVHGPGDGSSHAEWTFGGLAAGAYDLAALVATGHATGSPPAYWLSLRVS